MIGGLSERVLIFLFELGHVASLEHFLATHPDMAAGGYSVVALDPEIEVRVRAIGLPCISAEGYRSKDAEPRIYARDYAEALFDSEQWKFFSYRDVSLSRTYSFSLQVYLTELLYQADIIANVLARHPAAEMCIAFPALTPEPILGSCWMGHWIRIPVDVIRHLAQQRGKKVIIYDRGNRPAVQRNRTMFILKRSLFGAGITLLNWLVPLLRRPQKLRILLSDYWGSTAQTLKKIDSAETIFLDRLVATTAGIRNIWKYRMRFLHLDGFAARHSKARAKASAAILKEWAGIQERHEIPACTFRGFSLEALIVPVLSSIVEEVAGKTLVAVDGAFGMLEKLRPDVVMLRATTSAQPHFSILAQTARLLHIPSVEMLHGLDYYGPGSSYRFHEAEYVGVYGKLVVQQMSHLGPKGTKLVVIGSPRFDVYAEVLRKQQRGSTGEGTVFLCVAPVAGAGDIDMYDIVEFFGVIADALRKVPGASAIIKFRPGNNRDEFMRSFLVEQFKGIPYTIAQAEPLAEVFPRADVVISCFSTAALEALQCGKPLVYLGLSPSQQMLGISHFTPYAEQGAIRLITTKEELLPALSELAASREKREELMKSAAAFLEKEFAFDGRASERTAELIRSVVARK